ncbi:Outer membrane protein assembly factor BamB, contains PQQ-like beta-propeller repeat [Halogranum gelatinilyticum]|uniref:Outer membrane protein assembly factor BamB, contains PQQ-like beta-propeller repeat n=1 Tax=Halogranum gelatinilyticum TaxID=660521 RepID=A0A1G9XPD1_9EURY|nr:PQQ-binding-like beta-propeller repeat protein [Halogranum gelatinilyticum]SDM98628.1 Outer membrane protein assembly factor BamB, contains PQQ-like beta-propeller repeat [Halogranum gelatinilyticum]
MPSHELHYTRRTALALLGTTLSSVGLVQASQETTTPSAANATTTDAPETSDAATMSAPPAPAPTGSHPMFGVDTTRTGYAPEESGPGEPVSPWWCIGVDGSRLTPMTLVDGRLYVGSPGGGLRALDPTTGETVWETRFETYPNAPTVAGDRLFTSDGTAVYALGVESGRELWSKRFGAQLWTSVLVADGGPGDPTLFVVRDEIRESDGDSDAEREPDSPRLFALDGADGAVRWDAPLEHGPLYGSLAARDGAVYGGGKFGLAAFDAATGERQWHADIGRATNPAVGDGSVFVGTDAATVHALDPNDGSEQWAVELPNAGSEERQVEVRTSPAVADGTVYVAVTDGNLYALDGETGRQQWTFDGGTWLDVSPTVAGAGTDATVYVGSRQGNVFAVDAADGSLGWSYQLTGPVETSPVVVDGTVFVGDEEGRVHALVGESVAVETEGCRVAERTPTPQPSSEDSDNDGVPDRQDYAPRDSSVQRRSDLTTADEEEPGFFAGVGVGTAVAAFGAGTGWWLGQRGDGE